VKKCNVAACEAEHEGYCTINLEGCSMDEKDLITEEEYDRIFKGKQFV